MSQSVKFSVNLSKEALEALEEYARRHGISKTEALRRALGLQKFIDDEVSEGGKVLLKEKSGEMKQLVFAN